MDFLCGEKGIILGPGDRAAAGHLTDEESFWKYHYPQLRRVSVVKHAHITATY